MTAQRPSVLVTGAAGFIGMHVAERLLARGERVIGLDNLNDYYDPQLKRDRLARLQAHEAFDFVQADVADRAAVERLFASQRPGRVVHLAAQGGVRHSIDHPHVFVESNVTGFLHVLEGCRHAEVSHLVYASSSSVYGGNQKLPFSEGDPVDHPVSLYAATKKANELMAHTYSHLHGLPTTGLRFFTVYGPWGRPDMALFTFTRAILAGEPIRIYNHGRMRRDFTYIDDVVDGVITALDQPPRPDDGYDRVQPDPASSWAPYRLLNVGHAQPVALMDFIEGLEAALDRPARREYLPLQAGDVVATAADVRRLQALSTTRSGGTPLATGLARFAAWYRGYYPGA